MSPKPPLRHSAIDVLHDGHLIFSYGYSSPGAVMDCLELLGGHIAGADVRMDRVTAPVARLLVYARVGSVEAERVGRVARCVLRAARVRLVPGARTEDEEGGPLCEFEEGAGLYEALRARPALRARAWMG